MAFVIPEVIGFVRQNSCSFWALLDSSQQLDDSAAWEGIGISEVQLVSERFC